MERQTNKRERNEVETPPNKVQKVRKDSKVNSALVVTLPREKLLVYSREELDAFVTSISGGRKLTKEERKEVSRQRKLIKNRNSAAASRKRKKEHQEKVEGTLKELQHQQEMIKEQATALEASNQQMKQEITFLQNMINSNPSLAAMWHKAENTRKRLAFSSFSPSLVLAAKYLFLFLLAINLFVVYEHPTMLEMNIKGNFDAGIPISSLAPLKDLSDIPMKSDNDYIPTLMPPSYEQLQRKDQNVLSEEAKQISSNSSLPFCFDDLFSTENENYLKYDAEELFPDLLVEGVKEGETVSNSFDFLAPLEPLEPLFEEPVVSISWEVYLLHVVQTLAFPCQTPGEEELKHFPRTF